MALWVWYPSPCLGADDCWYKWERVYTGGSTGACEYDNLAYARWVGDPDGHFYARVTEWLLDYYARNNYECGFIGPPESSSYNVHALFDDPGRYYTLQNFKGGVMYYRYYPTRTPVRFARWPNGPHPY